MYVYNFFKACQPFSNSSLEPANNYSFLKNILATNLVVQANESQENVVAYKYMLVLESLYAYRLIL